MELFAAGDAVSWTALGVAVPTVLALIALGVAWGKVSAKVNNGFGSDIAEIKKDVKEGFSTIWGKFDELPCRKPHCPTERENE